MKVLWFANTPASGSAYLNMKKTGGGWIDSLNDAIKDYVNLAVAFYYPKQAVNFEYKNVKYYPIVRKNWKFELLRNIFRPIFIDKEDIDLYIKIIEDFKPDIIHILGTENPFGCIIDVVDIPVVISIQGNITICHHKFFSGIENKYLFKKYFTAHSFKGFPLLSSFKNNFKYFSKARERENRNLYKCKFIIGRTDWDRRITRVLAPESIYFHNDEILKDIFYEKEWVPIQNKKLIIQTTTSNSPYKGFETLCYALTFLNRLGIEVEWRVAGINESDLIVKVTKKFLKEKYPNKGLKLLGSLNENELANKLLEADIYVMPSHIENSPNNLCEAMILGMPCIATYSGGTPSLIENYKEGILVQDGDPWALCGAIIELKENKKNAIDFGKAARLRALKRHDKNIIVAELLKVYKAIIEFNK